VTSRYAIVIQCSEASEKQIKSLDNLQLSHSRLNIGKHKEEDIDTKGDCCFNHIIGLSKDNGKEKPIFAYEKLVYDCY
jgi:hypothetical protein